MNLFKFDRTAVRLAVTIFSLTPVLCLAQVRVAPGTITTIAGNNTRGYAGDGSPAPSANLNLPFDAVFANGNLYIADQANNVVRVASGGNGNISTVAGTGASGYNNDGIKATTAQLASPSGVAVDSSGNIYIADTNNSAVRKITVSNGNITTVAGIPLIIGYQGDGSGALAAFLNKPSAVVLSSAGDFYIADSGNSVIRKVTASTGNIATVAGLFSNGVGGYTGDGGPATKARLSNPVAIALDAAGNLYIADTNNNVVRKVAASSGIITTIAGNGTAGFSGDGRAGGLSQLSHPKGVAVDAAGNVYIADTFNSRIRMVTPNGIISTVIGTGAVGYSGDGGPATAASLNFPAGLSFDSAGNLYITDNGNDVIREYAPPAASGGTLPVVNGVISASAFGALPAIAPGSWIEIYGTDLAGSTATWDDSISKGIVPTSLAGTTISVGGLNAFIQYVSSGQVNVQVPSGVTAGTQQLVVATAAGQSASFKVTVNSTEPGLFAPTTFLIGGKQYVAALTQDGSFVLPAGANAGVTSRPAKVGETLTIFGGGFGPVTPASPAGQIASGFTTLTTPLSIFFGPAQANVPYYGLAPGYMGLYQFNVVVPNVASGSAVPLTFVLGSSNNIQTLYIAVQ